MRLTIGKILLVKNADLFPLTLGTPKELQLRLPQIIDRRVPAELGQESHASSCVEE